MLQVDLSQVIISAVIAHQGREFYKGADPDLSKNILKHYVCNMLLSYKKKYGHEYGKIVLIADNRNYWRKDYFPWYKGQRSHDRNDSPLDWEIIFSAINEFKDDLREYFPYKVLEVEKTEADDVIACLCDYLQTNECKTVGLFDDEPQPIMIISSDGDFVQLQKYPNVSQWSPMQKKLVKSKVSIDQFKREHIVEGDAGDNIPNVLTPSSWAETRAKGDSPQRQASVMKARKAEFIELGIEACRNDQEKANWIRNETLIDFDKIPTDVYNNIITAYNTAEIKGNKTKLMGYFIKHKMKVQFANIGDF